MIQRTRMTSRPFVYQRAIETREQIVVGVNQFQSQEGVAVPLLKIDPLLERQQIESLERVKSKRDGKRIVTLLESVRAAAQEDRNLMPVVIDAVRDYVTLGEISQVLREVFGEYRP